MSTTPNPWRDNGNNNNNNNNNHNNANLATSQPTQSVIKPGTLTTHYRPSQPRGIPSADASTGGQSYDNSLSSSGSLPSQQPSSFPNTTTKFSPNNMDITPTSAPTTDPSHPPYQHTKDNNSIENASSHASTGTPPVPPSLSGGNTSVRYCHQKHEWVTCDRDGDDASEFFDLAMTTTGRRRNAQYSGLFEKAKFGANITNNNNNNTNSPNTNPAQLSQGGASSSSSSNVGTLNGVQNPENTNNINNNNNNNIQPSSPAPLVRPSQLKNVQFNTQVGSLPKMGSPTALPKIAALGHSRSYAKIDLAPPPNISGSVPIPKQPSNNTNDINPITKTTTNNTQIKIMDGRDYSDDDNDDNDTNYDDEDDCSEDDDDIDELVANRFPKQNSFNSQTRLIINNGNHHECFMPSDSESFDGNYLGYGSAQGQEDITIVRSPSDLPGSDGRCSSNNIDYEQLRTSRGNPLGLNIPDFSSLGENWWSPQVELLPPRIFPYTLTTKALQNLGQYAGLNILQPTLTQEQLDQQRSLQAMYGIDSVHGARNTIVNPSPISINTSTRLSNSLQQSNGSYDNSLRSSNNNVIINNSHGQPPTPQLSVPSIPLTSSQTSFISSDTGNNLSPPPIPPLPPGCTVEIAQSDYSNSPNTNQQSPITQSNQQTTTTTTITTPTSLQTPSIMQRPASPFDPSSPTVGYSPQLARGTLLQQHSSLSPIVPQLLSPNGRNTFLYQTPGQPQTLTNTLTSRPTLTSTPTPFYDTVLSSLSTLPPVERVMEPIQASLALKTNRTHTTMPQSILHKQTTIKDELVGMDKARSLWEFEDPRVKKRYDFFRASTLLHSKSTNFTQWHFPQYFSQQPLLAGVTKKNILVQLPPDIASTLPVHRPTRKMLQIKHEDIVSPFITTAVTALYGHTPDDPQEYVFKVLGQQEYLDHPNTFWSYNYIRHCVRNNLEVELVLVKRPALIELTSVQQTVQENLTSEYWSQLSENTISNVHHLFSSLPHLPMDLTTLPYHQQLNPSFIPLGQIDTPFALQLLGIEGLNIATLPRYTSDIASVYLRIVLFHGVQSLPFDVHLPLHQSGTDLSLSNHLDNPSHLLDPIVLNTHVYNSTQQPLLISQLPREARIGFVLYGRKKNVIDKKSGGGILSPKTKGSTLKRGEIVVSTPHMTDAPPPSNGGKDIQLGFVVNQLIDEYGSLITGRVTHRLWAFPANEGRKKVGGKRDKDPLFLYRANNHDNHLITTKEQLTCLIHVKYPSFSLPVFSPLISPYMQPDPVRLQSQRPDQPKIQAVKDFLSKLTPLALSRSPLTPEQRKDIFSCRLSLVNNPAFLPMFLLSVDWGNADQRNEAYRLLSQWAPPSKPIDVIVLLDVWYPDYRVRAYAVNQLQTLKDDELRLYLLQLVQCLKYEANHYSPLAQFLEERAVQSPYEIGYPLYWSFKSEVHDPIVMERFTLLLEHLIVHIGPLLVDMLQKQYRSVRELQTIADYILHLKRDLNYSNADAMKLYREKLTKLNETLFIPQGKFAVPLKPVLEATELIVDKCRFMSSKMVPLWLVFKNADPMGPPIYLIFKSGDDLRQDLLTLQILRIMDRMWLDNGLDCRLKPYEVIATGVNDDGEGVGMIEVVLNSTTTADIQDEYGGGTLGALKTKTIDLFLRKNNPPDSSLYQLAVENFLLSCAGYCVATFILGIGDRHNGNIMVTKGGHLFHIDFGHFLGNFKTKFGINRERAAFVFTPEMAYVVGQCIPNEAKMGIAGLIPSNNTTTPSLSLQEQQELLPPAQRNKPIEDYKNSLGYKYFQSTAALAFQQCREQVWFLETLFLLLMPAGMPELVQDSDINYLETKLQCHLEREAATKDLFAEVSKALDSTSRRLDNLMHIWKHSKSK